MTEQNLWGDLTEIDIVRTPAMILQEQAALLGQLTNEVLNGLVRRDSLVPENKFNMALYIVAPALRRYRFKVLELSYRVDEAYPVVVRDSIGGYKVEVHDEAELIEILKALLTSESVKRVISTLISESQMSL